MLSYRTRKLVAIHVAVDVVATALAWLLAYVLRFHVEAIGWLLPVTKGVPDLSRYLLLLPLMAVVWPVVLYFHGLYQLKRGRSRIDEFFAILASVLIASALTLGATLYVRVYYRYQPEVSPDWEYSQAVFALFAVLNVLLLSIGRRAVGAWQEGRWAAGEDLTRVVVAGTGELGRTVADAGTQRDACAATGRSTCDGGAKRTNSAPAHACSMSDVAWSCGCKGTPARNRRFSCDAFTASATSGSTGRSS